MREFYSPLLLRPGRSRINIVGNSGLPVHQKVRTLTLPMFSEPASVRQCGEYGPIERFYPLPEVIYNVFN